MNELLKAVGLTALVPVLPRLLQEAQQTQPTYAAFLQQALEVEAAGRVERARERRVRAAHLPVSKTLEAFDFAFQPTIPERLIRELAELTFVQTATNLVFLGPPGVGRPTWRAPWRAKRWRWATRRSSPPWHSWLRASRGNLACPGGSACAATCSRRSW